MAQIIIFENELTMRSFFESYAFKFGADFTELMLDISAMLVQGVEFQTVDGINYDYDMLIDLLGSGTEN